MLQNPRLKYSYSAEFLDDKNVLLASEIDNILFTGREHILVLSEICSRGVSMDELVVKLDGKLSMLEVYYVISDLEKRGYITEAVPSLPQEACAYWNNMGIEVNTLLEVLQDKAVGIQCLGPVPGNFFHEAFAAVGIKTSGTGVLNVIITNDYQRKELRGINRESLESKQPWMLVKPCGVECWLGPVFLPGKTGCWECLSQRLTMNRQIDTFYKAKKNSEDHIVAPMAYIPMSLQTAANLAAMEIVKWLYFGKNEELEGHIITLDCRDFAKDSHRLVKRPQCKVCGEPGYKHPEAVPIVLQRKSSYCTAAQGGYREVSPEETIEKYKHHVSPITGVVQSLRPYHSIKGAPVYNYSSGRNMALQSKTMFWLNQHIRSASGGKGKNWSQAKAGALCEAVERYCMIYHGDESHITDSLNELGSEGIHPNDCMNFSEKQYRDREETNRACSKFYSIVPVPFDQSLKMHWTPVYSLTGKKFKYLPSCYCYTQYPAEDEANLFSYPDSNGCAAGNSLEEAILQGFLELVERDSVALWWYNMLPKPGVDLFSFNDPYFLQLIEYYRSLDRSLYVLDLTTDLQIPAFAAISHRLDDQKEDIVFGFGAHVDAGSAVERALVELNQLLPIANVPESDRARGKYRTPDKAFLDWLNTATMENQPYLVPLKNVPMKKASDYPRLCSPNISDSLEFCINSAAGQGLETSVLDLTRPDVGLNAVRVFVPGMRHFWKRLAPGRLYQVPVEMAWLKAPLKEEALNPVALFI